MAVATASAAAVPRLTLLGGPFHRLGRRLGLVRGESNTVRLGLAIGAFLWLVTFGLSVVEGRGGMVFSLQLVGVSVRLLVALPLFFLCETLFDPRIATFVDTIVRSGTVPAAKLPRLGADILRLRRWSDSWVIDVACLLLALAALFLGSDVPLPGSTGTVEQARAAGTLPLSGVWYWSVCLTVFRFALLRWLVRLALWASFLVCVARLDLDVPASHPDRAGGLGYLEVVHMHFCPLVFAFSAVEAASFAEGIAGGTLAFEATYPIFAAALALDAVLFLGPLLIFTPRLWASRVQGLSDFSVLGADYVSGFGRKWIRPGSDPGEPLLGTPDLQSLADLGNSSNVVGEMRLVPAGFGLLRDYVIVALLPMLPLLLLKYPVAELAQKFISRLSGL